MIVTLLTDYGDEDEFAGVCRAVIARIAPDARVIDLTHGIPRQDVRRGAIVLANSIDFVPIGVHVGVVDPTVGAPRRAVAVRCGDGRLLVGPDNGLLSLTWPRCGNAVEAVDVSLSAFRLEPVSATFHGRDIFAPVAARLAAGAGLDDAGDRIDPDELARLELPRARLEDGKLAAHALTIDRFGNVALDVTHEQLAGSGLALGRALEIDAGGGPQAAVFARTFADVGDGDLVVYEDASRTLAIAVNRGSAAQRLGVGLDDSVRLTPL